MYKRSPAADALEHDVADTGEEQRPARLVLLGGGVLEGAASHPPRQPGRALEGRALGGRRGRRSEQLPFAGLAQRRQERRQGAQVQLQRCFLE